MRIFVVKVFLCMALVVILLFLMAGFALGASIEAMTDENSYVASDGNIYTLQDGVLYVMKGDKLYEVVNGESQSIIDVIKKQPGSLSPDANVMNEAQSLVSRTIGWGISFIIYVLFALTALVTAFDLAYIAFPASRSYLCHVREQTGVSSQSGTGNGAGVGAMQPSSFNDKQASLQKSTGVILISRELYSLIGQAPDSSSLMRAYLIRRGFGVVIMSAAVVLLVFSSIFTDFGMNIGQFLYNAAAKFLGFV